MWLQRLPGRLLARRAAAVARAVSGGAPTLVIRTRAASLRRCLHVPRAGTAVALAPRQTTGAGRRRFSAGPDASNPAGDAALYLELSPSTVERLGAELSSHGELLRRLEDDFASLTNKDHKRFGMLQKLADVHSRWATARAGYNDALEMVAEYGGGHSGSDGSGGAAADDDESDEDAAEMRTMAEEEAAELRAELLELEHKMWEMLLPRDEADANNVLLETKAGVGGAEAALFTEEIFGMYKDYAARVGFKFEPLEVAERPEGGYRSATASVQALPGATLGPYEMLKFESGVHRVQRVPATEMQGRVHTSAVSVIVLPEPEEVEFDIAPSDIQKDVFRASGAGGQHVNTTESAVRLTHLPTGIKVAIQDERSQHSNYQKALKILRARVFDAHRQKVDAEHNAARQQHAGTGDRSEKVRTYNYHRDEVTDHRVRVTVKGIPTILRGGQGLDTFIDELSRRDQERRIAESSTAPDEGEEAAARK